MFATGFTFSFLVQCCGTFFCAAVPFFDAGINALQVAVQPNRHTHLGFICGKWNCSLAQAWISVSIVFIAYLKRLHYLRIFMERLF